MRQRQTSVKHGWWMGVSTGKASEGGGEKHLGTQAPQVESQSSFTRSKLKHVVSLALRVPASRSMQTACSSLALKSPAAAELRANPSRAAIDCLLHLFAIPSCEGAPLL